MARWFSQKRLGIVTHLESYRRRTPHQTSNQRIKDVLVETPTFLLASESNKSGAQSLSLVSLGAESSSAFPLPLRLDTG